MSRKTAALAFCLSFLLPDYGHAAEANKPVNLTIGLAKAAYRKAPGHLARKLGDWSYGDQVKVLKHHRSWVLVENDGRKGWLHQSAFGDSESILKDIGRGARISNENYRDEVATAGKGFNPEFEKMYKEKNQKLRYDLVDLIEKQEVPEKRIEIFVKTGQLSSRVLGDQK